MLKNFNIEIGDVRFEVNNMHVLKPALFQVYVMLNNKRLRFHLKDDGKGNLIVAVPGELPAELMIYESELSARILQQWRSEENKK